MGTARIRFLCVMLGIFLAAALCASARTVVSVRSNVTAAAVKRLGMNIFDSYWESPLLKVRHSLNFEGVMYRQIHEGTLYTNGIISYHQSTNQLAINGWLDVYSNAVFRVVSGDARGATGRIAGVSMRTEDIWDNGSWETRPFFEFDVPVNVPTGGVRQMGVLIENLSRLDEGYIDETGNWWTSGNVTVTNDNPPGIFGQSCARMDATTNQAHLRLTTFRQNLGEATGDWNIHFWMKNVSGTPGLEIGTEFDELRFETNQVPTGGWEKVELTVPVEMETLGPQDTSTAAFHLFVTGGVVHVDHFLVWQAGDTNTTAFRDDALAEFREHGVGVLRRVLMGGSTVSNWIYSPIEQYAHMFGQQKTVGPYGDATYVPMGMHEVAELCEVLDADPWFGIPGTLRPEEMPLFVEYLAGPTNTPGGRIRADLGHPQPWTDTLETIHVEFGNEAWNTIWWYILSGYNGPDYWQELIATAKSSPWYTSNILFHAAGQNFNSGQADRILGYTTNADRYAIAPYMVHELTTNNFPFAFGDYESQFKWFMAFPMYKVFEDGMPQQGAVMDEHGVEYSTYEFNYHSADFDKNSPVWTNIRDNVDVFLTSICHGLSTANTMLSLLEEYYIRTQCFFKHTGQIAYDGARLFGMTHSFKEGAERHRPVYYAQSAINKVLRGSMIETVHSANEPLFTASGYFTNEAETTNTYPLLYSYAFQDGATNGLVLINYDLTATQQVEVVLERAVKNRQARRWLLHTGSYTNNNELENPAPEVFLTESEVSGFDGGVTLDLAPYSMEVYRWESDGELPQVVLSTNRLVVGEGGTAAFTVRLSAPPAAGAVTVAMERIAGDTDLQVASGGVHVFTTNSWNLERTVTLMAAEDDDETDGSADWIVSGFGAIAASLSAQERENDPGLPFEETFEPGGDMAGTPGALDGQHGWSVSGYGSARVQSDHAAFGTQAAALAESTMENRFTNVAVGAAVDVTLYVDPEFGDEPDADPRAVFFYFNSNRYVTAYSNTQPVTLNARQASNGWNRLDVHADFDAQRWGLALNGNTLFTNFAFYGSDDLFMRIRIMDTWTDSTTTVDRISIALDRASDTDGDGLPDWWETEHFGAPHAGGADADTDSDTHDNLEEYLAGTDPEDADSLFRILDFSDQNVLSWSSVSGRLYSVYWTSNLLHGFERVHSNLPWTGNSITDDLSGASGFYKIEAEMEETP